MKSMMKPLMLAVAAILTAAARAETTWTVTSSTSGSNTTFTVTRQYSSTSETVLYRTTGLTAFAGQHFTATNGALAFAAGNVQLIMEETCCTLPEAIDAYKTGRRVAPPQYMTTVAFELHNLDGTTRAARQQLFSSSGGDLQRAYDYGPVDDPDNPDKNYLKTSEKKAFGFAFPDGTTLKANGDGYKANIPTILDKLESLAGKVHPRQQTALLFAVSQAGIGALKGGLQAYGVYSSEHAVVNFELTKNEETGAITVKYSSPEGLPVRFSWTATIDVDGNMASTPMVVEKLDGGVPAV